MRVCVHLTFMEIITGTKVTVTGTGATGEVVELLMCKPDPKDDTFSVLIIGHNYGSTLRRWQLEVTK